MDLTVQEVLFFPALENTLKFISLKRFLRLPHDINFLLFSTFHRRFTTRRLVAIAMTCAAMGIGISSGAYAATFKWASQGDILTFDPHAQNEAFNNTANSYVYEALLNLNKGKVQPCLAESWTSVPEGFVFKLRKGVKFQRKNL
ncbi:hypothetical protein [Parasutterella sp.]|uniref:hypothetical protein n=1 Tax=Parasutterella sp. TaxID=2049037 RepID=UPI0035204385